MRSRLFLYFLTALTAALATWAYITPIDVAVRARGIARPTHELVKIVTAASGVITTVNIAESSTVHTGDVLLALDATALTTRMQALQAQIHFAELRLAELDQRVASLAILNQTAAALDSFELHSAVEAAELTLSHARSRRTRATELFNLGVASRQALDEAHAEEERAEAGALRLTSSSLELKRAQSEARLLDLMAERTPLRASLKAAYKELEELRLEIGRLTLTSPVSGMIASAASLHAGEYIAAGTAVAAIHPESDPLVVESWLLSSDRTFISSGQTVRLRLESSSTLMDGFDGKVSSISPDVRTSEAGAAAYRVIIIPSVPENLRLGATFNVHFVTRSERLLFLPLQRIRREFQEAF